MSHIFQASCVTVGILAVSGLHAGDYTISGEQTVYNIDGVKTSALTSVSFTLARVGTNWSICNIYTNTGAVDTIAMVAGCTYSMTRDVSGRAAGAGLVMDNPTLRLEGAPIFPRALLLAFLTPQQSLSNVTNAPVPFLSPRHAGLHCYAWDVRWSANSPYLPEHVGFELDPRLVARVPTDAIKYYFRSGYQDRSHFKAFVASQRGGGEYSVGGWTNWNGEMLPLRSMLRFTTYDIVNNGLIVPQMLVTTVTNIAVPGAGSLIPPLIPGEGVQHIYSNTCYYYTSTDGGFLSHEQAKAVGRVLTPALPPPRWLGVALWLRSFPWRSAAPIILCAATLLVVSVVVYLLVSRR